MVLTVCYMRRDDFREGEGEAEDDEHIGVKRRHGLLQCVTAIHEPMSILRHISLGLKVGEGGEVIAVN